MHYCNTMTYSTPPAWRLLLLASDADIILLSLIEMHHNGGAGAMREGSKGTSKNLAMSINFLKWCNYIHVTVSWTLFET